MTEIASPDNPDVPVAAPEPDTDAALEFLQRFASDHPWVLAALKPEGGGPEVKTFEPKDEDEARRWINKHNGQRNLYFQVNPSIKPQTKKASKTDIKSLAWLHVDVDPRAGEDIAEEQKRILALLTANRPDGVPEPTCVIFSGGGYQAFWRLKNPFPLDGDLDRAVEAEQYNRQLETLFGADRCHNVDRIMRLPGTINIPNKKKRELGRVPVLTRLESLDDDRVYPLDRFQQAPASISTVPAGGIKPRASYALFDAAPTFLPSVDELNQWNVPDWVKQLIQCGRDLDDPHRFPSRSEALFAVVNELVRQEVPDSIILGIQLDPKFAISESVVEKGSKNEAYAVRQLERAKVAITSSWREVDKYGNAKPSYSNSRIAIQKLGVICKQDVFNGRKMVGGHPIEMFDGELSDDVCAVLRQVVIECFDFDPGKINIQEAANALCVENQFDPVRDYLDSLEWDGVPRIDTCLSAFFGAEDNELNSAISRKMFIAAVRRARRPGCKYDTIVVLEGKQGSGKSSALAILAGEDVFSDAEIIHMDGRGQQEQIKGVWIYEISELTGLRKTDIDRVKAFASRTHDRARPAYGRYSVDEPRRCIFVGTTNDSEYLRDATGNRRFWPVATGEIDLAGLAENRDQIWAEAAAAETKGESVILPKELWDTAAEQQDARREVDPWLDILAAVTGEEEQDEFRVSSKKLLSEILDIPADRQLPHVAKRLADCMRRLGWSGPEKIRIKKESVRGYSRPIVEGEPDPAQDDIPF